MACKLCAFVIEGVVMSNLINDKVFMSCCMKACDIWVT
jgi:hypothetical protein